MQKVTLLEEGGLDKLEGMQLVSLFRACVQPVRDILEKTEEERDAFEKHFCSILFPNFDRYLQLLEEKLTTHANLVRMFILSILWEDRRVCNQSFEAFCCWSSPDDRVRAFTEEEREALAVFTQSDFVQKKVAEWCLGDNGMSNTDFHNQKSVYAIQQAWVSYLHKRRNPDPVTEAPVFKEFKWSKKCEECKEEEKEEEKKDRKKTVRRSRRIAMIVEEEEEE